MTSVRLDEALEEALARSAEAAGETPSEFIRAAIRARIEAMSSQSAREALAPFIGVVESEQGSGARRSGEAFTEILSRRAR